jgi:DNA-binding NarL/FixJ family response regulator
MLDVKPQKENPMIAVTHPANSESNGQGDSTAPASAATRLLVVDDHRAVRRSLQRLLAEEPDFEVVDIVSGADAAVAVARREPIDVAVVDYQLGGRHNGLWLSRELKRLPRAPKVLVYSAYCDALLAAASVVARADGIVDKGGPGSQLCDAIRSIIRRPLALPVGPRQLEEAVRSRLSDEEQIIFGMLLNGIALDEIAAVLDYGDARLESRLSTMLSELEDVPRTSIGADHKPLGDRARALRAPRLAARRLQRATPVTRAGRL